MPLKAMGTEFTLKSPIQKRKNMKRAVENLICHRRGVVFE
jgi:hypothetical protein